MVQKVMECLSGHCNKRSCRLEYMIVNTRMQNAEDFKLLYKMINYKRL